MPISTIQRETVVSEETGEVKEVTTQEFNVIPSSDEPQYVKLYVRAWCEFKGLEHLKPSDKNVLTRLLSVMTYAKARQVEDEHGNVLEEGWGQLIYVNAALKRSVAGELNVKPATVSNALSHLVKYGILRRVDYGCYQVNPQLVGKGQWSEIKRLRATFVVAGPNAGTVEVETK